MWMLTPVETAIFLSGDSSPCGVADGLIVDDQRRRGASCGLPEFNEGAMDRTQCPAYLTLRSSTRRLLMFIEGEIARCGTDSVTLYSDQLVAWSARARSWSPA